MLEAGSELRQVGQDNQLHFDLVFLAQREDREQGLPVVALDGKKPLISFFGVRLKSSRKIRIDLPAIDPRLIRLVEVEKTPKEKFAIVAEVKNGAPKHLFHFRRMADNDPCFILKLLPSLNIVRLTLFAPFI